MEIEKVKLTQTMRKLAVQEAIQHRFKEEVEQWEKDLRDVLTELVKKIPVNQQNIETYSKLTEEMKRLVRVESKVYIQAKQNDSIYYSKICNVINCQFDFLAMSGDKFYYPFINPSKNSSSYWCISLVHSLPLTCNYIDITEHTPKPLELLLLRRKELMSKIEVFATEAYHALVQVKNIKEVRQHIPALEQFLDIPEKQFTKLVPYSFFDKVNKSINGGK